MASAQVQTIALTTWVLVVEAAAVVWARPAIRARARASRLTATTSSPASTARRAVADPVTR